MNRFWVLVYLLLTNFLSLAQEGLQTVDTTAVDTVAWERQLDHVTVLAPVLNPFVSGSSLRNITSDKSCQLLNQAMESIPSVYFKNYGNQQLSSISFRGTSASHTNVLWHGIPVNNPGLGQTDFATWPTWLINSVAVQAGSSSAYYGSGAIGGSVMLDERFSSDSTKLSLMTRSGSFGLLAGGINGSYQKNQWTLNTRLFGSKIENNFEVTPERLGRTIHQTNAAVKSWGIKQSIGYQEDRHKVSADFLFSTNDREIQPSIATLRNRNTLVTQNFRAAAIHQYSGKGYRNQTTLAFVRDETQYNQTDITPANQLSLLHRSSLRLGSTTTLQAGGLIQHASINSHNLSSDARQINIEPFASLLWYILPNWEVSTTERFLFQEGQAPRIIPAVGSEYGWRIGYSSWKIGGQWAGGFRYPSLNDRYWVPGGNSDLKAETSQQGELGLEYRYRMVKIKLTSYQIASDNWIIWQPGTMGIWSPINLRSVRNRGVELEGSYHKKYTIGGWRSSLSGNYTQALLLQYITDDKINNQLPYVPSWQAHWQNSWYVYQWRLTVSQQFTSKRFTTLDNLESNSLPAFYLLDARLSYRVRKAGSYHIALAGKNLLNSYYELQESLAMPGRNYELSLIITY